MEINISDETMIVVMNCLRSEKKNLENIRKYKKISNNQRKILLNQIKEVNDTIDVFEQFGF